MIATFFENWLVFSIFFGLLLMVSFFMMKQSKNFYTRDSMVRKFSILELQMPSAPKELVNVIKGMYLLPAEQSKRSLRAVRLQLWLDFLFMPLAYGSIFLLCWRVAHKTQVQIGFYGFLALALLQVVPWICDIIENVYLLRKIRPEPQETSKRMHKTYLIMEGFKWGISLIGAICTVSAIFYFWLTGNYSGDSLNYLLIIAGELALFFLAKKYL